MNKEGYVADTEVSYHHPWLGRIYYRGIPVEDFINNNFTFLETAYFLIKGEYRRHSKILELITSSRPKDTVILMVRELINSIVKKHLPPDASGLVISSIFNRVKELESLEKIMVIYLDIRGYDDALKIIKDVLDGYDYINSLNNYRIKLKGDYQELGVLYKNVVDYLEKGRDPSQFTGRYLDEYRPHILDIIREVVYSELRSSPFLNRYKLIRNMEKNIRKSLSKYLKIDLYTPLLFESRGILSLMPDILSIPGLLGMLAYIYESSVYEEPPDELIYKGPIGINLRHYLKNHLKSR